MDRGILYVKQSPISPVKTMCFAYVEYYSIQKLTTVVREIFLLIITQWMSQSYSINIRYTVEGSVEGLSSM